MRIIRRACFPRRMACALLLAVHPCLTHGADCFSAIDANANNNFRGQSVEEGAFVKLSGTAKGGELILLEMLNSSARYVRIDTHAGESADAVLDCMAAKINESQPFGPGWRMHVEGNLLKTFPLGPGGYLLAGTETGLDIPPPPTSLSVSYDSTERVVRLNWENPQGGYDGVQALKILPGAATSDSQKSSPPKYEKSGRALDRDLLRNNMGLRRFDVIGCRGGVLSNAAVITLNYQDGSQEELDTLPFTAGMAPNWKAWSYGGKPDMLVLEQGTKGEWKRFDEHPKSALKPEDRFYYQLIKTRSPEVGGGVCRKFLGLTPGHSYRIWTRMNTFDMDKAQGDWSFSFHAAGHAKDVALSPEQMAGMAPLPSGESGPTSGLIAAFGPGATTKGKFVECSTGKPGLHSPSGDITLPAGAEVITVWFKYHGPPSGGVGFDWIKLKDITKAQ